MISVSESTRIALIGGGKMGEAIMGGWIASAQAPADALSAVNFTVANPGMPRREYLERAYGVSTVAQACEIRAADIVVLAVKPQVMMGMLETIAAVPAYRGCLFVSIAAGMTTERLQAALPMDARLVRTMPNTPLLVGAGATSVCGSPSATDGDVDLVRELFACLGAAFVVDEGAMDATGALSGSGPAYVAAMIEALVSAGVNEGLSAELSEALAIQTVWGTAELLRATGQTPEQVRVSVCSPGGSTLAALAAMDEAGLSRAYEAGVRAAVQRSKELGAC
ncbi:pyrroline-5-carboxylate reductase [Raoultibacter phocaeensis]|uniref:pyrroline-5-carboxylate reductase n=1 Tax=Raoultibacter phocaeensis TaxID=2479841 RepID=UPI0011197CAB|nr:pyrroline-5-carboxylate reductase [Raoultibacter phocaeensis]